MVENLYVVAKWWWQWKLKFLTSWSDTIYYSNLYIPLFALLCFKTSVLSLSHTNPVLCLTSILSYLTQILSYITPILSYLTSRLSILPLSCPVLPLSHPDHLRAGVYHLVGMVCTPRRSYNQLPISAIWRDSSTLLKVVFVLSLKYQWRFNSTVIIIHSLQNHFIR